jgi:4-amino-4-deoxy-L-arabinose transferase-like glycosyltransferase
VLTVLSLVLLHLAVQWRTRPAPHWGDANLVYGYAQAWPDVPLDHHALRIGTLLPTRLFVGLFGPGQWSYFAFPILAGVLLVVATYALGGLLFGRLVALAATLLLVFSPYLVNTELHVTEWQLLPDVPSTAFFTAGMTFLVIGVRRHPHAQWRWGPGSGWLVAAGFLVGYAYLIREYVVFLFLVVVVAVIAFRVPWRQWWTVAAGAASCLVVEVVNSAALYGEPFARLVLGSEHGQDTPTPLPRSEALQVYLRALREDGRAGAMIFLTVTLLVGTLLLRRRALAVLSAWFLCLWVPLTVLSGVLSPHTPSLRGFLLRYWIPVFPAVLIGGTAVLVLVGRAALRRLPAGLLASGRRALATALVGALFASVAWYGALSLQYARTAPGDGAWNKLRVLLAEHPDANVMIREDYARTLQMYRYAPVGGALRWYQRIETFPVADSAAAPTARATDAQLLVVHPPNAPRRLPRPDEGWLPLWSYEPLRVYVRLGSPLADQLGVQPPR